jgi:1-acyl-sn-glycerol-3-phosphate acyltransferase
MQKIIIERPYQFIPPHRGNWWPSFIQLTQLYGKHLRNHEGVVSFEIRNADRLRASLKAGHGILLTPNHSRTADPLVMGWLARDVGTHVFALASWHLFNQDKFSAWAIHKMGGFSIYREGVDRPAMETAISILDTAERPLIIFPEGTTSRTNDKLQALLDGVGFIARAAAKKRAKRGAGPVVVHPIALKYLLLDDLDAAIRPVLAEIEQRFTWRSHDEMPLLDRITKIGRTLLCLKEIEHFGRVQEGRMFERAQRLINRLLHPHELEWFGAEQEGHVVPRIKNLRMKIVPEMIKGTIDVPERDRRWRQLSDIYLAQQVSSYPPDYLEKPTVERLFETVERYEEDLMDKVRVHGKLKVIIQVGEAIEVSPERERKAESDPLMARLAQELQGMLDQLSVESPLYEPK